MYEAPAKGFAAFALCWLGLMGAATAADLLPAESRVVAAGSAPVPSQLTFNIVIPPGTTAQDLVVTLTDLQLPAALSTASVAVTQNDGLVGSATLAAPATTATATIPAASGTYTMYVFGTPGAASSEGAFSACVAPKSSPSNCIQSASFNGNITSQSSAQDPTVSNLTMDLTVTTAGSYTFNFTDLMFPAPMSTPPTLALFQGSTTIQAPISAGQSLTLSPGVYTLRAIAQADQTTKAGVYGITITSPAGAAALLDGAFPVGLIRANPSFNNPATQSLTLGVTDYSFPGPLASAAALVTMGGTLVGTASAAGGAANFMAPNGSFSVWSYANPGSTAGTYSVYVAGSTDLFSTAEGVAPSGSTTFAYAFETPGLTAGAYQVTAADLQFPSQLTGLSFAVAQNGVILKQSTSAATLDFTAAAGPVVLLISAQTPASGGTSANGLFDVNVQTTGSAAQLLFDKTQSVSASPALFDSQALTLATGGSYDATLTDLKFPAQFDSLALVVSRGSSILGKVYGNGTFNIAGSPGTYQLTFVASPASLQSFGLYGVKVVTSVPPTVTLTASASSVSSGTAVTLGWTTTNTVGCTAGGGWSGSKAATGTGSETVTVTATNTYTLTCISASGASANASATVALSAAASGSHGGGGALDPYLIGLFGVLLAARIYRTCQLLGQAASSAARWADTKHS